MADPPLLTHLPTHERTLDNGLRVIVREAHDAPVVSIVTYVKAGYFDEPDTLVGISHVLEHMYFKGTERRGPGDMARETKAAGGFLNAGTIYDHTSYYTVLPAASLEQGLDIQSDALKASAIDPDELARELQVIIQEAKRKLDTPPAVSQESLFETLFDAHRIRRWRIGTEDMLGGFTRQDVWDFYRQLYRAPNVILVIAGDVEPAHAFALADRYYADLPGGAPVRSAGPEEPPRTGLRFREMEGEITRAYLEWGWRTPGALHEDTPALDALSVALGQGRASRLYRAVREAGLVSGASAFNYTPGQVGVFGLSAELDPVGTAAAVDAMAATVRSCVERPITAAEAERARTIMEARMLRRLETAEGQANLIAEWAAEGDWRLADDYLARIQALTAADLVRVAERYLAVANATVLLYRPRAAGPTGWDAAGLARRVRDAGLPAGVELPGDAAFPETAAVAPARVRAERVEDGVHFFATEHGARVVVLPRHGAPLVTLAVAVRGGALEEDAATSGITGLLARASVKGTTSRSAEIMASATEALGGSIGADVGSDTLHWRLSVPARHFDAAADLLLDTALRPALPAAAVARERDVALADLAQLRDDMGRYPGRLLMQAAFPGHPYGWVLEEREAALAGLERHAVAAWHLRRVRQAALTVLVVGDVEPEAAAARVAAHLGAADGVVEEPRRPAPPWPAAPRSQAVRLDKAQTALALGFPGPARNEADVDELRVLSAAVAGLGGRMFEELRSRRSLAYSVAAYPVARWRAGCFVASIATSPEREEEARAGLLEELDRLRREPLPEEEVERARRYLIGAWQIHQQTNGARLADLMDVLLVGEGLAELRNFEARIRRVSAEGMRAAAERWLDPARMVEGVVRGSGGGR